MCICETHQGTRGKKDLSPGKIAEHDFFLFVKAISNALSVSLDTVRKVMAYWKLKRRANFNRPLITPKHEESTALAEAAETNLQRRLRMFTQLR